MCAATLQFPLPFPLFLILGTSYSVFFMSPRRRAFYIHTHFYIKVLSIINVKNFLNQKKTKKHSKAPKNEGHIVQQPLALWAFLLLYIEIIVVAAPPTSPLTAPSLPLVHQQPTDSIRRPKTLLHTLSSNTPYIFPFIHKYYIHMFVPLPPLCTPLCPLCPLCRRVGR